MLIAVTNDSTLVTNAQVQTMCQAIQIQLDLHVLPAWNLKNYTISFYADKTTVPGYAWVVSMLDNSTQAGALGYHSLDNDQVDAFIFAEPVLSNGGTVLVFNPANPSQYTVSATLSHEVCEMVGDRYAGGFSQGPQIASGNLYCQELCDPVENDSYGVTVGNTIVSVSNFVFPSFFNPDAVSPQNLPFDYLNKLTAPFTMDAGGYMIVATLDNEGQITAEHLFSKEVPQWKKDQVKGEFYRRQSLTHKKKC
jgi:hypothetical protein